MNLLSFIPDGEQFKIDPNNKISSKIQNIHNNVQYRLQLKRFINPINNRTFATDFRILEKKGRILASNFDTFDPIEQSLSCVPDSS